MRLFTSSLVGCLLIASGPVAALPSLSSFTFPTDSSSPYKTQSSWRRLSNSIIGRIWQASEVQAPIQNNHRTDKSKVLPGKLVASYGQDVVLRFSISSAEEAQSLAEASNILFLDVWDFGQTWADIRIAKDVIPSLLGLLPQSLQSKHIALMDNLDLATAIIDTYPSTSATSPHDTIHFTPSLGPRSPTTDNIFFQSYQPLSVIEPWMNLLASMFPTHVRRINVGISYEGRDIPALRVGVHPGGEEIPHQKRKTILITGGLHAREWISTSTVNYVAWSLITSYGKDPATKALLEAYDWVFVPTLNPDGYVYSWESDRLWRKNRQPTSLRFCKGIDLDRSFPYQWDGESTAGNPCSESYSGATPLEGVESQRFVEWAKNETENNDVEFVTLLDLHSYSQQVMYPYSYTCTSEPPTIEDLEELALGLAKAIRLSHNGHGHMYHAIPACEGNVATKDSKDQNNKTFFPRIESGGGSLLDFFYHEMRVKYAYQIKLRDTGSYGFLLPKENIAPTGREILEAVMYLGKFLLGEVGLQDESTGGDVVAGDKTDLLQDKNVSSDFEDWHNEWIQDRLDSEEQEEDEPVAWELRRRRRR
ncbi:hypothetical protein EJ05DRAFT_507062 [Pseudovirgaria hyperparasitica]|uniref:Inactive metallocarboxypeptidase ECM14 n=1 Tax=Pseudovirgaria hyperparasitica TaxID=470096 RepID=A0A6A6WMX2_9PEZI|nr:uncharacterized protein EJ05DRAFT_507062 [Pseudovirgaria hyperparasitica]KAF2763473.1 hypothetical protein EJ05DRAFT_507062 [Pseudovirgaria hyperparasitica]